MAPEIDQSVFSWSNFLFNLSGRQVPKQFVRSFHVGLPLAEGGVDERFLCGHSFTCLSFVRIACPQSILFLPLLRKLSSEVPTWRFIAKGRCSIAGSPCSRRIVRKTQVRLLCPLLMRFSYEAAFGKSSANGYERLLLDAMLGDATLFSHRDGVEASWALLDRKS